MKKNIEVSVNQLIMKRKCSDLHGAALFVKGRKLQI